MEMEFVPLRRRSRLIILVGVVLAIGAGASAFVLLKQAESDSTRANTPRVNVVVAAHAIPARKTIDGGDVVVKQLPADSVPTGSGFSDTKAAIGKVAAVTILEGQPITANLFASATGIGGVAVLGPDETVTASSPVWRAVALNVPDDRALGGLLMPGQSVDVFVTVPVSVPADLTGAAAQQKYYADRATKILYQAV